VSGKTEINSIAEVNGVMAGEIRGFKRLLTGLSKVYGRIND
jgi:hypothetical protein